MTKFFFLILVFISFTSAVIGQQIKQLPCEWVKRYESGPVFTGDYCPGSGDWWKVVSTQPNNTLYSSSGLIGTGTAFLDFKENAYVIDETSSAVKVVKMGHYDTNMNLKASASQNSGWISKDKLLLHTSCLVVKDLGMPGYSGTVINKKGVILTNVDASNGQSGSNPRIYSEPEFLNVVSEPKEFRYAFVFLKRGNSYLVGEDPLLTSRGNSYHSNSLMGWISENHFIEWNTNLALEPNWDRTSANRDKLIAYENCRDASSNLTENLVQHNTYRLHDPKNGKRLVGETPRLFWLGHSTCDKSVEKVGYVGDLCYLDQLTNRQVCLTTKQIGEIENEFKEIKKKQRQVKLLFVVDGTQSIQKFSGEIKQTIDEAMRVIRSRYAADDSYSFNYGCVMYWDVEFGKRTDKIGWVSDPTQVSSFIRNNLDNPPGNPNDDHEELLMEGLDVALRSFRFESLESNFIMLIGDAGSRQDEYDELSEKIVQKLSESYFNLLAIQFSHNPSRANAYNLFRSQVKELIIKSVRQRYPNYSIPDLITEDTEYGKQTLLSSRWGTCWLKEPEDGDAFDADLVTELIREGITTIFSQGLTTELNLVAKKLEQQIGNKYPPGSINMLWDLFNRNYGQSDFDLSQVEQVIKLAYTQIFSPNSDIRKLYDVSMFDHTNLDLLSQYLNSLTETVINNPINLRQSIIEAWWEILKQSGGWTDDGYVPDEVLQFSLGQLSEMITGLPGKEIFSEIHLKDLYLQDVFTDEMLYEYIFDWIIAKAGVNSVLQGKTLISPNYISDHYWPFLDPYISYSFPDILPPQTDLEVERICKQIAAFLNMAINSESIDFYVPKIDIGGTQHFWLDARIFPHDLIVNKQSFNEFLVGLLN